MCTFPRTISNPQKRFRTYYDRVSITVPCGHCDECVSSKRSEWFIRSYYEYLSTIDVHGFVLAPTLTYNPENIPMYNGLPCFDSLHIRGFIKRLRKSLFDIYKRNVALKYLICSEYGGNTHRPHYHALLFFKDSSLEISVVMRKIKSAWNYGFVGYSKKKGALIKGVPGIKYATKYITKDIDFSKTFENVDLPRQFHSNHYQSKGFGSYIIDILNLNNNLGFQYLVDNYVPFPLKIDGTTYSLPKYIERKVLCTVKYKDFLNKKVPMYIRTSEYFVCESLRITRKLKETTDNFKTLFNSIEIILNGKERLEMFNRDLNSNFTASSYVRSFLEKVDLDKLSIYCVYFHNRLVDNDVSLVGDSCFDKDIFSNDSLEHQKFLLFNFKKTETYLNTDLKVSEYLERKYGIFNRYLPLYNRALLYYNGLRRIASQFNLDVFNKKNKQMSNLKILQL